MTASRSLLLRMRNVSDKRCGKNQNAHCIFNNIFVFENLAVYEIKRKNIVERGRPQMTIWRMRIACWISKVTKTHSQYVIVIDFPLQPLLHKRATMLYIHTWPVLFVLYKRGFDITIMFPSLDIVIIIDNAEGI
jgi:hypothetical protein